MEGWRERGGGGGEDGGGEQSGGRGEEGGVGQGLAHQEDGASDKMHKCLKYQNIYVLNQTNLKLLSSLNYAPYNIHLS